MFHDYSINLFDNEKEKLKISGRKIKIIPFQIFF
jgi:hypothetical protein